MRKGELPPCGGQHRWSSLATHSWVVPYAGWNPPMLVGGALCRAEPSRGHTARRRGPEHPPFMRTRGSPCSAQHMWSSLPSGLWVVPYAGWNPPMLVGGALCRAEPSITGGWQDPLVKPPVKRPPGARHPQSGPQHAPSWTWRLARTPAVPAVHKHKGQEHQGGGDGSDEGGRQSCHLLWLPEANISQPPFSTQGHKNYILVHATKVHPALALRTNPWGRERSICATSCCATQNRRSTIGREACKFVLSCT